MDLFEAVFLEDLGGPAATSAAVAVHDHRSFGGADLFEAGLEPVDRHIDRTRQVPGRELIRGADVQEERALLNQGMGILGGRAPLAGSQGQGRQQPEHGEEPHTGWEPSLRQRVRGSAQVLHDPGDGRLDHLIALRLMQQVVVEALP